MCLICIIYFFRNVRHLKHREQKKYLLLAVHNFIEENVPAPLIMDTEKGIIL